jgi:predicted site-specific integrase-resolvase
MGNYYSYKRISIDTERQNFNRQIKSLERYAKDHDIEYLIDFTEEKSAYLLARKSIRALPTS